MYSGSMSKGLRFGKREDVLAMTRGVVRAGKIMLGIGCLVLGVVGLFLPFLQGILFLIIGLTLLSGESARVRSWLEWLRRRVEQRQLGQGEDGDGR